MSSLFQKRKFLLLCRKLDSRLDLNSMPNFHDHDERDVTTANSGANGNGSRQLQIIMPRYIQSFMPSDVLKTLKFCVLLLCALLAEPSRAGLLVSNVSDIQFVSASVIDTTRIKGAGFALKFNENLVLFFKKSIIFLL